MDIQLLTSAEDLQAYDRWVKHHPQGSLWQSVEWKNYQEALGRETRIYAAFETRNIAASALVVIDKTTGGFSTWDCSRGPLSIMENGEWKIENYIEDLMIRIFNDAKNDKCLSIHLSPALSFSILNSQFSMRASARHEQPEATRMLDLTLSDEQLLAQMHQKGRYNIKVAQKNGVTVTLSDDIDAYLALAQKTSQRDGFVIPSRGQLSKFLHNLKGSFLLLAEANGQPVAGLLGVVHGTTGIYYYGASDHTHRALMAPYLLQWHAMQYCRERGCERYDLLGVAPPNSDSDHPWSGISSFKEKFGGTVVTYPAEQQIVLRPVMNMLLRMKRKILG